MTSPVKHYPSEEATQHQLLSSLQKHAGTNTPSVYDPSFARLPPCVACLCFCLCKITVVQVSSRQSSADRQACESTAKHFCSPQRSFLVLQLAVPAQHVALVTKTPLFQQEPPLHLRDEHRGRRKVLSRMKRQSGFLFQRAADVHGSRIPVLAVR